MKVKITCDGLLEYGRHARPDGRFARCHLVIYEPPEGPVVIAGQLEDAAGISVINAIEDIADRVRAQFYPDGRDFDVFVYSPPGAERVMGEEDERYVRVWMTEGADGFKPAGWDRSWTRERVEKLVGCELPRYLEGRYK